MYNNESAKTQLNWILDRIGFRLEITETQRKLAEERYNAVGKWLAAEGSSLAKFKPVIYPQGSLRIDTTTKPIKYEEYDLDLVCELQIDWRKISPKELHKTVYDRICLNEIYKKITEPKKRCIRINYANEFHLDILPACPDLQSCATCIWVPDRKMNGGNGGWSASNPKGYANWFEKIAEQYEKLLLEKRIEPLPKPVPSDHKAPLKRAVQLLKRWRDIEFQNLDELAPVSIVLTTLAGHLYRNDSLLLDAFTNIVNGIVELIERTEKPIIVYNPTNVKEILSEKWLEKPEAYKLFKQKIAALKVKWHDIISNKTGLSTISQALKDLFGETVVNQAIRDFNDLIIAAKREAGQLGIHGATGSLSSLSSSTILVPNNTFHGNAF